MSNLFGVTPPKVVYPCCHCCHPADFDALGYTVGTPGCAREDQDRHPNPCLMCGQRATTRRVWVPYVDAYGRPEPGGDGRYEVIDE